MNPSDSFNNYFKDNQILKSLFLLLLGVVFCFGVYMRWKAFQVASIGEFASRDFSRAFNLINGNHIPLAGPDLSDGGRLPGPFFYFLLAVPLIFNQSYEAIFAFNFILNVSSIVVLFFLLKRYFNFYFSSLSCIFLCISSLHIRSLFAPMNPAFLPFFTVLFLVFLMEFSLKKNKNALPCLILVLSLSIQIHYSMIVFYLVPLVTALIFKIKINLRMVFVCLMIPFICFIPYWVYKFQIYIPRNLNNPLMWNTFHGESFLSFVKIITIQNSIERILYPLGIPYRIGFSLLIYSFITYIIFGIKKRGVDTFPREILVLSVFLIPAYVYEIAQPTTNHYWYRYIFIFPTILILVSFLHHLFKLFDNAWIRSILTGLFFILLFHFIQNTYGLFQSRFKYSQNTLIGGSFKNAKLLHSKFMKELKLGPVDYFYKVFFLGARRSSLTEVQLVARDENVPLKSSESHTNQTCFFIVDPLKQRKRRLIDFIALSQRFTTFLNDKTIQTLEVRKISFISQGFLNAFHVYKYKPRYRQSCYYNLFNQFVVDERSRQLLRYSEINRKRIGTNDSLPGSTFWTFSPLKEEYNSNEELILFKANYLIDNYNRQSPFYLKLRIKKENAGYILRGDLYSYYHYGTPFYNLKALEVIITPTSSQVKKSRFDRDFRMRTYSGEINPESIFIRSHRFRIVSPHTLISSFNFTYRNKNYNPVWFREWNLPSEIKLIRERFYIDILWTKHLTRVHEFYSSGSENKTIINVHPGSKGKKSE